MASSVNFSLNPIFILQGRQQQFILRSRSAWHKAHPTFGVQDVLQPQGVVEVWLQSGIAVYFVFINEPIGTKTCGGDIACEVVARPWYAYPVFLYPLAQLTAGGIEPEFNIARQSAALFFINMLVGRFRWL